MIFNGTHFVLRPVANDNTFSMTTVYWWASTIPMILFLDCSGFGSPEKILESMQSWINVLDFLVVIIRSLNHDIESSCNIRPCVRLIFNDATVYSMLNYVKHVHTRRFLLCNNWLTDEVGYVSVVLLTWFVNGRWVTSESFQATTCTTWFCVANIVALHSCIPSLIIELISISYPALLI